MRGGQCGADGVPAPGHVGEHGERGDHGECGEQADDDVHIGDGAHAGDGGKQDDEARKDVLALHAGDDREDEVQNVAAADVLVAGDGSVGEKDREYAEDTGCLVVASLQEVRDGELRELSRARCDEVDEQQAGPAAAGLPQGGEAVFVGVLRAAQQGAGADPAGEQCKDQNESTQAAPSDKVIRLGFYFSEPRERNAQQSDNDDAQDNCVQCHASGHSSGAATRNPMDLLKPATEACSPRAKASVQSPSGAANAVSVGGLLVEQVVITPSPRLEHGLHHTE